MRKLFIVLTLFGASILNAQQLNVASYNVRNSNPNDAKAGNGWEQRYPILTQLITFHDFDIFGAQYGDFGLCSSQTFCICDIKV